MWNVLSKDMRMPALAVAACAAVMLVASPVSAATSSDYRAAAVAKCDGKKGRAKGNCMDTAIDLFRQASRDFRANCNGCDASAWWAARMEADGL